MKRQRNILQQKYTMETTDFYSTLLLKGVKVQLAQSNKSVVDDIYLRKRMVFIQRNFSIDKLYLHSITVIYN